MEKKYEKIIKHLYKNLQKKDELKNEFEKVSNSISLYLFIIFVLILFVFFFAILEFGILPLIFGLLYVFGSSFLIKIFKFKIFNNLVSKKLSKYNLFNLYGRNYDFNIFLSNIIEEIIDKTEKEDIKPYIKEITHIINSISEGSTKNNIKMKFIEKMQIDIDSQLIDLTEDKIEEKNMIKIDCKSIVVNS